MFRSISFGKSQRSIIKETFGVSLCLLSCMYFNRTSAQTLSESLKKDPKTNYFIIKRLTKTLSNPGYVEHMPAGEDYYLGTCDDGPDFGDGKLGGALNLAKELGQLAATVVTYKTDLKVLKYPEATWRPMLIGFEDAELDFLKRFPDGHISEHQRKFELALAASLQQYRLRSAPSLPKVVGTESGCGAGEISATIKSDPPHARIQLISTFTYLVCEAKSLEPEKADTKCDGWYDAANETRISGLLKYRATWPDGVSRVDNLNADKVNDGDTVILFKPSQVK